jgi:plasmid maintenance system antidote protein VapI
VNQRAHVIGMPPDRTRADANGTRSVAVEADLRVYRFFSLPEGHFLRLQNAFDMLEAKQAAPGASKR